MRTVHTLYSSSVEYLCVLVEELPHMWEHLVLSGCSPFSPALVVQLIAIERES